MTSHNTEQVIDMIHPQGNQICNHDNSFILFIMTIVLVLEIHQ